MLCYVIFDYAILFDIIYYYIITLLHYITRMRGDGTAHRTMLSQAMYPDRIDIELIN
jgi:hypothetical protein